MIYVMYPHYTSIDELTSAFITAMGNGPFLDDGSIALSINLQGKSCQVLTFNDLSTHHSYHLISTSKWNYFQFAGMFVGGSVGLLKYRVSFEIRWELRCFSCSFLYVCHPSGLGLGRGGAGQ